MLRIEKPSHITQTFGVNARNGIYDSKGHSGVDYTTGGYGEAVESIVRGVCEVTRIYKQGDDSRIHYWAVYTQVKVGNKYHQVSYGHLSDIKVKVGDKVRLGDVIGLEGNGGTVVSGGKRVTEKERLNGSQKGHHVHFSVYPVDKSGKKIDFSYNKRGTIDPSQFYKKSDVILPTLRKGNRGIAVKFLQLALSKHRYRLTSDGVFGPKTERKVIAFQKKSRLVTDGICGKATWSRLV
jgi:murein DD-endopeptidase MepM/ murein hydrolase activator NlpD